MRHNNNIHQFSLLPSITWSRGHSSLRACNCKAPAKPTEATPGSRSNLCWPSALQAAADRVFACQPSRRRRAPVLQPLHSARDCRPGLGRARARSQPAGRQAHPALSGRKFSLLSCLCECVCVRAPFATSYRRRNSAVQAAQSGSWRISANNQ